MQIKQNIMINLSIAGQKPKIQLVEHPEAIQFIYIDLFCGAGGTTTGLANAKIDGKHIAIIAACVNHDPLAIESHWKNHPEVMHFEEDIRTLDLNPLVDLISKYRKYYPKAKIVLWASLECTNFSKAKGGQPRDADSRTLAEHLYRYVECLHPDYIQIENVVEFMSWGPLNEFGKPMRRKNGSDWIKWRNSMCQSFGYQDEWREMNSADFGAYTSRNRLFGCFAKDYLPIVWPKPTHSKNAEKSDLFGDRLKKWMSVKDVLDFKDEGISIFNRKKNLSPKTLERIYAGLIKYVAGGRDAFLSTYNSGRPETRNSSVDRPCKSVLTANTHAKVQACFLQKYYSGRPEGKVIPVTGPAGIITTAGGQTLVNCSFIQKHFGGNPNDKVSSIDKPAGSLTTKCHQSLVQPIFLAWLDKTYTGSANHQSINQPAGAVLPNDKHQKVHAIWLDRNFTGGGQHSSIDKPAGSVMPVPKMNIVQAKPFVMNTSYGNIGKSIEEPAPPILASRRHYYLVNPSHGGHSTSVENPCPVIVARQDKAPLYLSSCTHGVIFIFDAPNFLENADWDFLIEGEGEPSIRIKIIEFMFLYNISDIKMRMLKVSELLPIQGFPRDYILVGNQSDQKKFIGNSVVPHVVTSWIETLGLKIREAS